MIVLVRRPEGEPEKEGAAAGRVRADEPLGREGQHVGSVRTKFSKAVPSVTRFWRTASMWGNVLAVLSSVRTVGEDRR